MGIPLRRGRFIGSSDTATTPPVIVIDDRLAARFWPGEDPIGKRMFMPESSADLFKTGPGTRWLTVIGVVGTVRERGLVGAEERLGACYHAISQRAIRSHTFAIKTAGNSEDVVSGVRAAIGSVDPELPLYSVKTLHERMRASLVSRRAAMVLALGFGLLALFLSAIGIYGMLAYQVTHRTREIGIRVALGSSAQGIFRMILGEGMRTLAIGFGFGLAGSFALGRAIEAQLYGVRPMDPSVVAVAAAVLGVVALLAAILPARRATRIDPVVALSQE